MEGQERLPLSMVVAECVKRWFQDTLKEARNGDAAMQVLVGQMYQSGYGVPRNEQKVRSFCCLYGDFFFFNLFMLWIDGSFLFWYLIFRSLINY